MAAFAHVILTRFNLGMRGFAAEVEAWHNHRFSLFEQFCLPSVEAQTCRDFAWLLLFDRATPQVYFPRIEAYTKRANIQVHFLKGYDLGAVPRILGSQIGGRAEFLISTTLDNDDALARDFVARVQREFREQDFELLNFVRGLRYDLIRERLYACDLYSNPFMSLIERILPGRPLRSIAGCLPHSTIADRFSGIVNIRSAPAWLQVIHDRNLQMTRMWGRTRVKRDRLPELFELEYEIPVTCESAIAIRVQNLRARAERLVIDALSDERRKIRR
jgi:hypothetical protein